MGQMDRRFDGWAAGQVSAHEIPAVSWYDRAAHGASARWHFHDRPSSDDHTSLWKMRARSRGCASRS
eukprot:COSAG01_NODE_5759_length_4052_cov_3.703263_7_plen_67_part_00